MVDPPSSRVVARLFRPDINTELSAEGKVKLLQSQSHFCEMYFLGCNLYLFKRITHENPTIPAVMD